MFKVGDIGYTSTEYGTYFFEIIEVHHEFDGRPISVSYICSHGSSQYGINPAWLNRYSTSGIDKTMVKLLYF